MNRDVQPDERMTLQHRLDEVLRQQRDLLDGLQRGQSRFKSLARSVWRVQEQEQRKLARELHDGIGQNLGAIASLIDRAMHAAAPAHTELIKAHALTISTLAETRALSRLLRPQILDDLGLDPALHWLTRTFGEAHGLEVHLDIQQSIPPLHGDLSTLIFRTTQEALANVARHANARRVEVSLHQRGSRLSLSVRDDGRGCEVGSALAAGSEGQGSGLGGMRDRMALYDGELSIASALGAGFKLTATIPISTANRETPA